MTRGRTMIALTLAFDALVVAYGFLVGGVAYALLLLAFAAVGCAAGYVASQLGG